MNWPLKQPARSAESPPVETRGPDESWRPDARRYYERAIEWLRERRPDLSVERVEAIAKQGTMDRENERAAWLARRVGELRTQLAKLTGGEALRIAEIDWDRDQREAELSAHYEKEHQRRNLWSPDYTPVEVRQAREKLTGLRGGSDVAPMLASPQAETIRSQHMGAVRDDEENRRLRARNAELKAENAGLKAELDLIKSPDEEHAHGE